MENIPYIDLGSIVGPQGVPGANGAVGPQGEVGPIGPRGAQGEIGPRGPQGAQGPMGVQGLRGLKGEKGDTGAQGLQGEQGPQGLPGDINGDSVLIFEDYTETDYKDIPTLEYCLEHARASVKMSELMQYIKGSMYHVVDKDKLSDSLSLNDSNRIASSAAIYALASNLSELINQMHPIGSKYESMDPTDPGELFGGTWESLSGVMTIAADGSTYKVGQSYGARKIVLNVAQLPAHNHTFSGTQVTTNSNNNSHTHTIPAQTITTSVIGDHSHTVGSLCSGYLTSIDNTYAAGAMAIAGAASGETTGSGRHSHTVSIPATTTGVQNGSHAHTVVPKGTISNTGSSAQIDILNPCVAMYAWYRIA